MLKITAIENSDAGRVLKLEGKLLEPWLGEILNACADLDREERSSLDLSGVTFVDQAGVKLLHDLIRQGVGIAACSGFVAELLQVRKS